MAKYFSRVEQSVSRESKLVPQSKKQKL